MPTTTTWREEPSTGRRKATSGSSSGTRSPRRERRPAGTILFVHGSSMASQPTFDLYVPGRPDSSVMDWFAARGFDTWCMDNEGYGRSDKTRADQLRHLERRRRPRRRLRIHPEGDGRQERSSSTASPRAR